jgi:hypothetical protein
MYEGGKAGDAYSVPDLTGFTAFTLAFSTMFQHSQHKTFNQRQKKKNQSYTIKKIF